MILVIGTAPRALEILLVQDDEWHAETFRGVVQFAFGEISEVAAHDDIDAADSQKTAQHLLQKVAIVALRTFLWGGQFGVIIVVNACRKESDGKRLQDAARRAENGKFRCI